MQRQVEMQHHAMVFTLVVLSLKTSIDYKSKSYMTYSDNEHCSKSPKENTKTGQNMSWANTKLYKLK